MLSRLLVLFLATLSASTLAIALARADGKFYVRRDVPRPGEPFQRALIVHDGGKQFLLVQPSAVGDIRDFGWVIPVPSVPAVGTMESELVHRIFFDLALETGPAARSVSGLLYGVSLILLGVGAIVALARGRRGLGIGIFAVFLLVAFLGSPLMLWTGRAGLDVVAHARVGLYDTTVLRASEPDALRQWLDERGFAFGPEDDEIFRSYIERGWSFVAARVSAGDAGSGGEIETIDGLLQPLALLFESPAPVYPYALTATAGHPVEVVLYVAARQRVQCSSLETEYAGPSWPAADAGGEPTFALAPGTSVTWSIGKETQPDFVRFQNASWLTKLRATLEPGTVRKDLELPPAADPEAFFRPVHWRW